jgi:hypothetical protein
MMLNAHHNGLGPIIQYVGKEKTLHTANEYDTEVIIGLCM